jgi:hypothetical protein
MTPDFMMAACAVCFGAVEFFLTLARRSRDAAHLVETRQERPV